MAKTTILGLNLTEDENTSFSDWRKTIDGNGSGSTKSNFQIIDEAIGSCLTKIESGSSGSGGSLNEIVLDRNSTFADWVGLTDTFRKQPVWYKFGEPNGDGFDLEPEVLITQLTIDSYEGVWGASIFGLVSLAPLLGGGLRAVGVFLNIEDSTVTHFEKELIPPTIS